MPPPTTKPRRAQSRKGWDSPARWQSTAHSKVPQGLRRWARLEADPGADVASPTSPVVDISPYGATTGRSKFPLHLRLDYFFGQFIDATNWRSSLHFGLFSLLVFDCWKNPLLAFGAEVVGCFFPGAEALKPSERARWGFVFWGWAIGLRMPFIG